MDRLRVGLKLFVDLAEVPDSCAEQHETSTSAVNGDDCEWDNRWEVIYSERNIYEWVS